MSRDGSSFDSATDSAGEEWYIEDDEDYVDRNISNPRMLSRKLVSLEDAEIQARRESIEKQLKSTKQFSTSASQLFFKKPEDRKSGYSETTEEEDSVAEPDITEIVESSKRMSAFIERNQSVDADLDPLVLRESRRNIELAASFSAANVKQTESRRSSCGCTIC
mmetsp:Transcript_15139/g.17148  ORF Transcript_15139/g.17148 Transcript_15139/m.17148 type:complete len:164 (+) Transcript_15139:333-824(+)|eukprot:CAMPEP_0184026112 /NCGR_PEP_ID=MMETSP0954-20121128/13295_1 /TAXON_ID=627963 /ORGANISM="Aplanochytrium sp, Strain PBS07" /LENGTH=163 /DNA_ID=CAMNT_0026310191 /DNA_START=274 /DNA_END=765 /DNA_ORIENTATION=+